MTLSTKKKLEYIDVFLEAAIAYYIGGDWRTVFRLYSYKVTGQLQRRYQYWSTETNEHFEQVVELFFNE